MKTKTILPLIGLVLLPALVVAGLYVRSHADTETDAGQASTVPTQQAPENPSLPMKRLDGSDRAEILEAIKKQQSRNAGDSDSTSEPDSMQSPAGPAD